MFCYYHILTSALEEYQPCVENKITNARKRLSTSQESSDEFLSPSKIRYNTSNEDSESSSKQIEVQVSVHNHQSNVNENTSPNRENRRHRVRQLIISQQLQNSPDIIEGTPQTDSSVTKRGRGRPKKTDGQISSSNTPTIISEKRKIITLEESIQRKGDFEERSPKTKKSKLNVFSENKEKDKQEKDEQEKEKLPNAQSNNVNDKLSSIERSTRRKRVAALNTTINRKSTDKGNQDNAQKARDLKSNEPIKKRVASLIPTRLNRRVDPKVQGKVLNSKSADPKRSPKPNKGTKSSSASVTKQSSNSSTFTKMSTRKSAPNVSPVRTPARKALFNGDSTPRHMLSLSAPPTRKANSNVAKKITPPHKQKELSSKISTSLTNLDNSNYRTRRGLTKEFVANNVMTRKRTSIDGAKLLEKIDTLTTVRRKNSIGMDASNEKSKKTVPGKSAIPIRSRRK